MAGMFDTIHSIRYFEELALKNTVIHRIHPVSKLCVTLAYIVFILSFDKYEITGLLPYAVYPVAIFILAEISVFEVWKRMWTVIIFVTSIGAVNLILDREIKVVLAGIMVSGGVLSWLSLMIKCILSVMSAFLLISTTGIHQISYAMMRLGLPKIMVLQFELTFRYAALFIEEIERIRKAYQLRAPGRKRFLMGILGSLIGQMLLRAMDRAERVYEAMSLRGFRSEYAIVRRPSGGARNMAYFLGWTLFFLLARVNPVPELFYRFIMGVVS